MVTALGLAALGWARTAAAEAGPCELMVFSRPKGATVFVDGKERGQTPLRAPGLSSGQHRVRVVLDGYEGWSKTVRLRPGPRIVSADLKKAAEPASPKAAKGDASAPEAGAAPGAPKDPKDAAPGEAKRGPEGEGEGKQEGKQEKEQKEEIVPRHVEVSCGFCQGSGLLKELRCRNCTGKGYVGADTCGDCGGKGTSNHSCPYCGGNPVVAVEGRAQKCRGCAGRGHFPCPACRGRGKLKLSNPKAAGVPTRLCQLCDASGLDKSLVKCRRCGGGGVFELRGTTGMYIWIRKVACLFCGGKGRARPECRTCLGKGYVRRRVAYPTGETRTPCRSCFGTGHAVGRCRGCGGRGWIKGM